MTLELRAIRIARKGDDRLLFPPLSLTIPAGEVVTVMGPSGIGKSTLMDFIGGHLAHGFQGQGQVILNGQDITDLPAEARQIGLMFQDAALFPHLSVADNLAFGLTRRVRGGSARAAAVTAALAEAGLDGFGPRDPARLSGGEKARAALMRTLLAEPKALLLDEPFSKLDPDLRADLRRFVFDHIRARAIPVMMVTHDATDAEAAGGPVLRL